MDTDGLAAAISRYPASFRSTWAMAVWKRHEDAPARRIDDDGRPAHDRPDTDSQQTPSGPLGCELLESLAVRAPPGVTGAAA